MRPIAIAVALSAALLIPAGASAAPCAGFTDVDDASPFCVNVAWMRNRGITLGCTATLYCPNDYVTRLQMAAFMYRLGFQNTFLQGGNAFGATAVLGTTDNQPLEVRVNGVRGLRVQPTSGTPNVIGGYLGNTILVSAVGASIGGGGSQTLENVVGSYGTIGGGRGNFAEVQASVAGGIRNIAGGQQAAIGGGSDNFASGVAATIGGGSSNSASDTYSQVAGGSNNSASGIGSTIGGGTDNVASGTYSTIAGGSNNVASGSVSFAAGVYARANAHCAVFSFWGVGPGMQCFGVDNAFFFGGQNGAAFDYGQQRVNDGGGTRYVGIGRFPGQTISTWTGAFLGDNGVWTNVSDEAAKEGFEDVDGAAILDRVAALPVRSWRYKVDPDGVRRLGPTAQDFWAAFGLGTDERTIATVDADGVALAALKALNAKLEARIAAQQSTIDTLVKRMQRLERRTVP